MSLFRSGLSVRRCVVLLAVLLSGVTAGCGDRSADSSASTAKQTDAAEPVGVFSADSKS